MMDGVGYPVGWVVVAVGRGGKSNNSWLTNAVEMRECAGGMEYRNAEMERERGVRNEAVCVCVY